MSDPELNEKPERGLTESCPIPNASAQETQPDLSASVFSHGSEVRRTEEGQESSLCSVSFVPSPKVRASKDTDLKNHNCAPENAKSYTTAASVSKPIQSLGESDLRDAQKLPSDEKKLTIPSQEVDPDTSFVVVTSKLILEREYSNGKLLSGFVNLLTEDESSLSTANSEADTLSSETCSNNTVIEDNAEIHRDPTTDNIGEDDGLPFHMDDINEGAPSIIEDGDQVKCKPAGHFTGSLTLSFGNDSNTRPLLSTHNVTANYTQQNDSATPTPTQRSPSTSNASETSTASSHSSVQTHQNHTEGMHRINNAFPYLVKSQ